jgi:diacylglycerol kinase family enzyme
MPSGHPPPAELHPAPLLGILPAGTTNVLAYALGLPPDPRAAASLVSRLLAEGAPPRQLDVGLAAGRPVLMMASAGFDAFVLRQLDPRWKAGLGKAGIALTALRELRRYASPELELEADGEPLVASFAAVCNVPFYGGPYALAPLACCDDRRLDLVTFAGSGVADTLAFGIALARGAHLDRLDVAVRRVDRVVIRGPSGAAAQIDGDPSADEVPIAIELAPSPLQVLAPPPR